MKRYEELDSLRGIAALTVVISHMILMLGGVGVLDYTPLYLLWSGHEAVIFFYVLSGFVLSLAFYKNNNVKYSSFITKRSIRIYSPYLVSLLFTFLLYILLFQGGIFGYSDWLDQKWNAELTLKTVIDHVLLLGNFPTGSINPVIWSLSHEMRISIIFPFIIILILKFKPIYSILVGLLFSSLAGINYIVGFEESLGWKNSFMDSLHFTSMFIIGALLAKYIEPLVESFVKLKGSTKAVFILVGLVAYAYSRVVRVLPTKFMVVVADWGVAIGVCIIMVSVMSSEKTVAILKSKFLAFNGKISYSLYLYHIVVLVALVHLLGQYLPMAMILVISVPVIYICSYLSWRFIEMPSIRLGKVVTDKFNKINSNEQTRNMNT